jgi:hypothetical protein
VSPLAAVVERCWITVMHDGVPLRFVAERSASGRVELHAYDLLERQELAPATDAEIAAAMRR